jgi:hypothetical protein
MPPPPGSRRTDVQRSLCAGTTRSTAADTSMAGFIVKVTTVILFVRSLKVRVGMPRRNQFFV